MENILITGATSAFGKAAIRWCKKSDPACNIIALGRSVEKLSILEQEYGISSVVIDFSLDEKEFKECINSLNLPKINTVFHFIAAIPDSTKDIVEFYKINFLNARIFFDVIPLENDACILNSSTSSVYKHQLIHISEITPKTRSDNYGISKLMFENYLMNKQNRNIDNPEQKLTILNVRIPILLVPGVGHNFISKWRNCILNDEVVTLFNPEGMFNSCVCGEDILDFFEVFNKNYKNRKLTCNVGADKPMNIYDVFCTLTNLYNKKCEFKKLNTDMHPQYYDSYNAIEHGYKPRSVAEILRKYSESDP